jgi:trehalose/maltose transport system permease protein
MIVIDVWKTTPFMALLLLAGLQLISREIYEAADVDGASKWRQFWSMTIPLLRPAIAVALIFRTLDALRVFDVFQIVLAQSRYSMASYTYYQLIGARAMGYSSASSVVIFLLILVFAMAYIRLLGVESE